LLMMAYISLLEMLSINDNAEDAYIL